MGLGTIISVDLNSLQLLDLYLYLDLFMVQIYVVASCLIFEKFHCKKSLLRPLFFSILLIMIILSNFRDALQFVSLKCRCPLHQQLTQLLISPQLPPIPIQNVEHLY